VGKRVAAINTAATGAFRFATLGAGDYTVRADHDRLVASRTEAPLRQLSVTVLTVSGEVIEQQGVTNLVDELKNVPNTDSFTLYGM
jgi:outer membrane receptor for monomeric catechols